MLMRSNILFLLLGSILMSGCCKEQSGKEIENPFIKISERNELPYTLPTESNIANDKQTKGIFFYDRYEMDITFRSIGVQNPSSERARLWIEIKNPDLHMFAGTRIDTLFADSTIIGGTKVLEVHNKKNGQNFYKLDTALLASPFSYDQLGTYRPKLDRNTIVTAHIKLKEANTVNNFAYDVERGALKRVNHNYIGFKNVKDGNLFFIELEGRYTIKSIEVRKD